MRSGFSLVELSIVLVILGLLTGGILTGQNLIRAAELRSVTTEYQGYVTAVNTFRDKYFQLPGDMNNAEDFWGTMATGACPNATAGTGTQTCNGDGDGVLANAAAASQTGEKYLFWQHLANAGLIEGSYTGIAGSGGIQDSEFDINVPRAKLGNAGWDARNVSNYVGDTVTYAMDYGNTFMFGQQSATGVPYLPNINPEEAWNIDTKIDDAKPASGKVIALYWNNACAAADDGTHANNDLVASYKLSDNTVQCALYFRQLF